MEEQEQVDVASVFRVIFCSCDVDNTDLVPVSKLIEFVQPFMIEDLNALEDLRHSLDPEGINALVNSDRFYQVMDLWSQKITATSSSEETEFNKSPSRLQVIDENELPYTHSTPRASLGDKLLKCKDLLNLSNVSGYSLSTSRLDTTNPVLEEEIKKLEHQLSKTSNELAITKQQLTASEEQNETLQQDVDRLNRRLHAEQQVNEHLQKEKTMSEELRDELSNCKKYIEDLKKKLSQSEKDSMYHRDVIDQLDNEKLKLEKKIEVLSKQHQDCLKQMFDFKTELETKEQQMTDVIKVYDELKLKFAELKDFNDQLREENDILGHQKSTLEKAMKAKSFSSPHSNLGNLNLSLTKTPSPHHSTQNTCSYSNPNLAHQSGIQSQCQSMPLLRRVLGRHSSTPVNSSNSLLDSSLPESVKSMPVLSPVCGTKQEEKNQHQDSSEEDLFWKLQERGVDKMEGEDLNGTIDSLQIEMHRADPIPITDTYHTVLFEKDEQIIELEEELEKVKKNLKESEDQKNDFLTKLREQNKINENLIESNFKLVTKEEFNQTKIESLKNRLAHLEQNGVIMENDHENSQGEIEDLKNNIILLKQEIEIKEIEIKKLKSRIECDVSLEQEIAELKERLRNAESLKMDYDKMLQEAMKDLGKVSVEKISVEEKLKALQLEKQNIIDSNALALKEMLRQTKDVAEKLSKKEQLNENISEKSKLLEDETSVLKHDLECAMSKYEHLSKQFVVMEKELSDCKDLNNNKDEEIARCEDDKRKMALKFEENLRLKDDELTCLKNIQKEKDEELELFKKNLEKKLVGEFEGKVKYSMEAEEKILNLTKKCKQLEEDLKCTLSKLSSKSRSLAETENRTKLLQQFESSLKQEIDSLKGSKTELELTVAKLKREQEDLYITLQKVDRIDVVALDIQKHIKDKDIVIEELKQLNKKLEYILNEAQLDIKEKINEIFELRNEWSKSILIKNELWNRVKSLQSDFDLEVIKTSELNEQVALLHKEKKENEKIIQEIKESDKLLEELKSRLNEEINKNSDLSHNLLELKKDHDHINNELVEIKQEKTNKETEMVAILQQKIEDNNVLGKELSETKENLHTKEVELTELVSEYEEKLKVLNEKNIMLNQALTNKCKELEQTERKIKDNEEKVQVEIEIKNGELLKKLTNVERLLEQRKKEMRDIENNNRHLLNELDLTKNEKDKINNELEQNQMKITHIKNINVQQKDELIRTKQEKEILNNKLQDAVSEIIQLKAKVSENEKEKHLLHETKQKLQEEITKNKAIFKQFSLLKQERDQLNVDLNDIKTLLSDTTTLYNKKQTELKDLQVECSELNSRIQSQTELLKKSEVLLQVEINKNNEEKKLINFELLHIKSSLDKANLEISNMEMVLLQTKKELGLKCLENERLILDLEEAKRKWSESFNSDGSTCSVAEKETSKRKTYSRQQIAIEKLKENVEDMENQLKLEKSKNQELKTLLLLAESKIIGDEEGYKKEIERLQVTLTAQEKKLVEMETEYLENKNVITLSLEENHTDADVNKIKCEGKTVNKFTLAARCPASPDSPSADIEINGSYGSKKLFKECPFYVNCDSTIDIPPLDINGSADEIIEELELIDGSPRKKLDRDQTEKNVTALTLRLLVNSNDISKRIEDETEKYRSRYAEILNLIRDISHRLRDHVCIGTAEPIMPVFILLEEIKIQIKEVVQTAGQVGVLIYEDRMKKCWNLATNYMAMLRQENELLHNTSRETTPTQTGPVRRRNKFTQDKADLTQQTPYRRRRVITCTRLIATLVFVMALAVTFSIMIHLNCRMTASENQYCPLDGIITRVNVGVPPM